jgi:GDPmannose 4,6-dehydratase
MCREMVEEDLKAAMRHRLLRDHGFDLPIALEA